MQRIVLPRTFPFHLTVSFSSPMVQVCCENQLFTATRRRMTSLQINLLPAVSYPTICCPANVELLFGNVSLNNTGDNQINFSMMTYGHNFSDWSSGLVITITGVKEGWRKLAADGLAASFVIFFRLRIIGVYFFEWCLPAPYPSTATQFLWPLFSKLHILIRHTGLFLFEHLTQLGWPSDMVFHAIQTARGTWQATHRPACICGDPELVQQPH